MATTKLTVPILLEWKDIEAYMAQHDIVEVVRCKDCKHFRQHSIEDIKRCGFKHDGMCVYWNSHSTNFEWFCINGERKETEDGRQHN